MQAKQNILLRLLLAIISSLFLVCSAAFAEEVVEVAVSKGDCLIKIAEEHLDDPAQWGEVARINHLKNADLIYPGQTIVIPVRLLRGIPGDGVVTWIQGDVTLRQGTVRNGYPFIFMTGSGREARYEQAIRAQSK